MEKEFCTYNQALRLKALGFDEPCLAAFINEKLKGCGAIYFEFDGLYNNFGTGNEKQPWIAAPTFSQAINFLYICSNKQIDIELKASDTYEERLRKIDQGCEDLWNLQNSKSN